MTNISLNISSKIDPITLEILEQINHAALVLDLPYMVVGAVARDMIIHLAYGADIQRATEDYDFGIQVSTWNDFNHLRQGLIKSGFRETKSEHRIISPSDHIVDIIPFGSIENQDSNINWPPDGSVKMSVLGFQEAIENAELVRIREEPVLDIPVVSPPGLALLKIIAWIDKSADLRQKDARDLKYLFRNYEQIPHILDEIYESPGIMEKYDWDLSLAATHLLGIHTRAMAKKSTVNAISELLNGKLKKVDCDRLAVEMSSYIEVEFERNSELLRAFSNGFISDKVL